MLRLSARSVLCLVHQAGRMSSPARIGNCAVWSWRCVSCRYLVTRKYTLHTTVNQPDTFKQDAVAVFNAAVKSVLPHTMVKNTLTVKDNALYVAEKEYSLKNGVYIVAFGKAVLGMVRAAEDVLGGYIVDGVCSVPAGMPDTLRTLKKWNLMPTDSCKVFIKEGARDNIPDNSAFEAAQMIEELLLKLKQDDVVLTFISGGGSALLPYPKPPITLEELALVTKLLSRKGATIQEMNAMRKHLEKLKGGGLARAAYPAKMAALILSDVIDDDIDFIASGPTVRNLETPSSSLSLIERLGLKEQLPHSVLEILHTTNSKTEIVNNHAYEYHAGGRISVCLPYDNIQNVLIGTNAIALEAAKYHAEHLGYSAVILTSALSGNITDAAVMFTKLIAFSCGLLNCQRSCHKPETSYDISNLEMDLVKMGIPKLQINEIRSAASICRNSGKPLCILAGGETTVKVTGDGLGGRNQELALLMAEALNDMSHNDWMNSSTVFLSAGTDGQDGPTDGAGAVVDTSTISSAIKQGLSPQIYLDNNDSYNFFKLLDQGSYHVTTGLTGTNVMDIQVIILKYN